MKPQITQINAYNESRKTGNATVVGRSYYGVPGIGVIKIGRLLDRHFLKTASAKQVK